MAVSLDDMEKQLKEKPVEEVQEVKEDEELNYALEKEPEVEIETPEEKKINPDEEKEYLLKALETGDENVIAWVKYNAIGIKQKEGKELTDEEKAFMEDMNRLYALDKQAEAQKEEQEKMAQEEKEKILREYNIVKEADPSKIDKMKQEDKVYRGGDSIPKLLKFALAMKKVKKKGGKVLVKITRDRQFFIEWTNKDIQFVEFFKKDEKGNMIPEITRFQEYKYTYEGSPIPVLFAVQGHSQGFDFYDQYRKDITSEMVSRIASRAYHSGYLEGINLRDKSKPNGLFAMLTEFMPLILIIGLLILGYLMYQQYQNMAAVYQAVQTMQVQMNTLVPTIDVNSIVLK